MPHRILAEARAAFRHASEAEADNRKEASTTCAPPFRAVAILALLLNAEKPAGWCAYFFCVALSGAGRAHTSGQTAPARTKSAALHCKSTTFKVSTAMMLDASA